MLKVITTWEAEVLLKERFPLFTQAEETELDRAPGRTLFSDLVSREYVPDFDRSTVDGFALRSSDTFGCSESIPALLRLTGEVQMGRPAGINVKQGSCVYVPTGGQLPQGSDAIVMLEFTEDFGGGTIAVAKPCAPGSNVIFRGDDVSNGELVYRRGYRLRPKDIGALAAMGRARVSVFRRPVLAVISTGDELVEPLEENLRMGQMRDVNGPMLSAAIAASGGEALYMGIVPDDPAVLERTLTEAVRKADVVLLSGGSSVGAKDAAEKILSGMGEMLFHGLALKPGKPTLAADIGGKPIFGLPGHPVAAYFIYCLLVRPLIYAMMSGSCPERSVRAKCARAIPSNHGREECVAVRLDGDTATPVIGKSGLITTLSGADGYIRIPREAEGVAQGDSVRVFLFSEVI
ncbi:MAG: gephyrin-like molybdotransferase Glp [Oscillospiraceae bacterium]|nr:gephyrin-like molybdotransferase Glp [Oscillospiraceae bacterium]